MIRDKDIEIEDNYDLVRISKWFQVKKKDTKSKYFNDNSVYFGSNLKRFSYTVDAKVLS